jgi:TM2 domain-containing membrane protein YozV
MKSIGILCSICMFHFVGYSGNYSPEFYLADSLKEASNYEWAALEYERICYETFDNTTRTVALNAKANCLLALNNPKAAQKALLRINYFSLNDSMIYDSRYLTGYASYLTKDFEQAKSQFFLIEQFLDTSYQVASAPLYALSLNELREWEKAEERLNFWAGSIQNAQTRDSLFTAIQNAYSEKNHPKYRNPETASILSTIIPGSGQLYAGYIADALFSVLMTTTGLGLAAVGILVFKYYIAGAVVGLGMFQRFWSAGTKRSSYLAEKKNHLKLRKYNTELSDMIFSLE